ncbi:monocarboxylate permease, putative [Talaromyces stipitatus ATCC 10500]|uniref:Monocarboxylate permease, putative n=1 Tax=Talaromyces stipitatus (strain ATCC 10500 / CBS 375.48 / QM 6759 / NRRL 1006) TaxID=441959 RepID=B8MDW4_TALSN|nr:monocarboxylate permease, putative [Talaromyces stipitatus ATCC 10500]EED16041.1 monocarboxylate permease, putative [Talaromyces stipitatus ATCC 10500]
MEIRQENIVLQAIPESTTTIINNQAGNDAFAPASSAHPPVDAIPDGGYGWTIVFACFIQTSWVNAWAGSWGIFQSSLIQTTLKTIPTSTLTFVGSLGLVLTVSLGLVCIRLSRLIGARWAVLIGTLLFGASNIVGGLAVNSLGGLFVSGVLYGLGGALMYTMSNSLPVQWFSTRLGTANGLVKLGGGIGATIMVIVVQLLIERVEISWTFHIMGLMSLASGVPAALLIKERAPSYYGPSIDLSTFRRLPFSCLFAAGAIGVFPLYVPAFFLPFGSTNTLLFAMVLNSVTMFAIWPVSSTLALLLLFAALNGLANGAFFVTMPTAVGRFLGPGQAAVGIGMAVTGWSVGDFLGAPIAGFLIQATGANQAKTIGPYKPAIFYAAGTALVSTVFVLVARLKMDGSPFRRL